MVAVFHVVHKNVCLEKILKIQWKLYMVKTFLLKLQTEAWNFTINELNRTFLQGLCHFTAEQLQTAASGKLMVIHKIPLKALPFFHISFTYLSHYL